MKYNVRTLANGLILTSLFACLTFQDGFCQSGDSESQIATTEADVTDAPDTHGETPVATSSVTDEKTEVRVACSLFNADVQEVDELARDAEFALLAKKVTILEQQAAVLRSVVKLVGPSVVHIEAEKEQKDIHPNGMAEKDNRRNGDVNDDSSADAVTPEFESYDEGYPSYDEGSYEGSYDEGYPSYPSYDDAGGYSVIPNAFIEEAGSGVLIRVNNKTYVLTNRHVVIGCELKGIRIKLHDGRLIYPEKKWEDPNTDVAILQVSAPRLVAARLGNSDDVEIGDFVLAFGSPFGLSRSVTYGIISAKGRRDLILGADPVGIQDFLQTDAAINPGNSGGPLLNTYGQVIGLNTAIASNSGGNDGIGFSIPINIAVHVAKQLVDNGELIRAYLGVHLDSAFRAKAARELGLPRLVGARVTGVTSESPAEKGELKVDDVIVRFNDIQVEDDNHLVSLVGLTPPGAEVKMVVVREGAPARLVFTLCERDGQSDHY